MELSPKGLDLIKDFEGFSSSVYICPAGHKTIGYGHRLTSTEAYPDGISRPYAAKLLTADVHWAEDAVNRLVKVELTQDQLDALVSLVFNIGARAFARSRLLWLINSGQGERVAGQGGVSDANKVAALVWRREHRSVLGEWDWCRAGGEVSLGLVRRRMAEATLFRGHP